MNIEPKIIELLKKRGIETGEEIHEFLSSKPQRTYDPFLLHNMEEGVDLILSAIEEDKKICIYGDYDADGITSTVIMMDVLTHLTKNIMYYIPSRFDEGYGLNMDAIDKIQSMGGELIITVDCGSVSKDEVDHAKEIGMEILVTDHHRVSDKIADCPVINPNQPDCNYPCPHIAGCGVAFKICQAIVSVTGLEKSILNRTLDMLGIGTIGDIVPLVDENRTFAKYGIRAINSGVRKNLRMLIERVGLKQGEITSEKVSFGIVPYLNAAGRMEHASLAVQMFLSEDKNETSEMIEKLCSLNMERKNTQDIIFKNCIEIIEEDYKNSDIFLVYLPHAHEGVTGIVAGKVKERYNRPSIILTDSDEGFVKGTGRSAGELNIYDLLKACGDLFKSFGGHRAACGFTLAKEKLEELRRRVSLGMEKMLEENSRLLDRTIEEEIELEPRDLSIKLVRQLSLLEPCGAGNEKPVIAASGTPVRVSRMGRDNQFLRFYQDLGENKLLQCVNFNNPKFIENLLEDNAAVKVVGRVGINSWNGNDSIQMTVETVIPEV